MQVLVKKCIQIGILIRVMYKRPTKQQQLRQRITMFTIMIVSIVFLVTAIVLSLLGYRLDGDNGRLEQGALVQFDSIPASARISIDDQATTVQTPSKRSVMAGVRKFTLERDQYRSWSKTLDLAAGTLTWLDYVRLVPNTIPTEVVREYSAVTTMKASPDRRSLLVQTDSSRQVFQKVAIQDREVRFSDLVLPAELYSQSAAPGITHRFTLDEWDESGRYVLVRHDFNESNEWLVVDTESVGRSQNVSRLLGTNFSELQFSGTSGNVLYGLTDGILRKVDLSTATTSRALVSGVASFELYDTNVVTYIGRDPVSGVTVAGLYRDGDTEPVILERGETAETNLAIDTSRHYNDRYISIAKDRQVTVYRGSFPTSSRDLSSLEIVEIISVGGAVSRLNFSPEGDYVVAQTGAGFVSYEVEHDRLNRVLFPGDDVQIQNLRWLDKAYLWAVLDNKLMTREFDGNYAHSLMPAMEGLDVSLSPNGRFMYAMTQTPTGYALKRATMILE